MSDTRTVRTVRLVIAYDGTDFRGFAESEGVRTVMSELRRAVQTVVRSEVELTGAGRTDAGVHAWGQVVSGDLPVATDLGRLQRSVNGLCAPDIVVRDASWAHDDFSARFDATARTYHYDVWNSRSPNPFLGRVTWQVPGRLDVEAMNAAAAGLLGEHDFSSFCRKPKPGPGYAEPSLVRHLYDAGWQPEDVERWDGSLLRFRISASSFCHQMVRSVVGTLVDVGLGRRSGASMEAILGARDRSAAGQMAPPTGLVLWTVDYSGRRWDA